MPCLFHTVASPTPVKISMYINRAHVDKEEGTFDTMMYLKLNWVDSRLAGIVQGDSLDDRMHFGPRSTDSVSRCQAVTIMLNGANCSGFIFHPLSPIVAR